MVLQLKLTLLEADPPIWRRFLVDEETTLLGLHRVVQILMGWWDYHLFAFRMDGGCYVGPEYEREWDEEEARDAAGTTLRSLKLRKGSVLFYTYDFGDAWRMEMQVERRRHAGRDWILPCVLEGERAGPPEDSGGIPGLRRILEALVDPRSSELAAGVDEEDLEFEDLERYDLLRWLGDLKPDRFDKRTMNHFLLLANAWGALDA